MQPTDPPGRRAQVWDAIVVGAGPAGTAAAYDLAAAGRSVLLLDRAEFPRPKACAGGLTIKAVRALRYSIDPVVRVWVRSLVLEGTDGRHTLVRRTLGRRAPVCAMTVREELDSFCFEHTRRRGAIFRRVQTLQAIEQREDEVLLHSAGESFHGRYLVGADGVHSRIRALAGAESHAGAASWFRKGFAIEANVPCPDAPARFPLTFDFAAVPWGYGWLFPRNDHINIGLYTASTTEAAQGLNRAAMAGYIAARCGPGTDATPPVGQFLGFGAAAYQPAPGARILLAGDAAGCVDPLTGEGIYGAIRSGQAAAAAIHAALRADARGPNALAVEQFVRETASLREDLAVAEHAARRFYPQPARGFDLLRLPLLPRAALRAYAEGSSLARLLRTVRAVRALTGVCRVAGA